MLTCLDRLFQRVAWMIITALTALLLLKSGVIPIFFDTSYRL